MTPQAPPPWPAPLSRADLEALRIKPADFRALALTPEDWARLAFDALPAPTPP